MNEILHSVCLKHDNSLRSLTKQALAQIIVKLIYKSGEKGIIIKQLRNQLIEITNVKFADKDISDSIAWLKNTEKKVYQKQGKFLIKPHYRKVIDSAVEDIKEQHNTVIEYWFGQSETYKKENGHIIINEWFKNLLIEFFKYYSYDWIKDLVPKRNNGKKKIPDIESIIKKSLESKGIENTDNEWLTKHFIDFIESDRHIDNELLWNYGSSRFSATLLTARNYADEFSLNEFKGTTFILDTNVLMILELEAFEQSEAINSIEKVFTKLDIRPKYFYITKEEYKRAIGPKRDSTLSSFDKYSFDVFKETDCVFVKTALRRQCSERSHFETFFERIMDVPKRFGEKLNLELEDTKKLHKIISEAETDEKLIESINKVHNRRTGNIKRPNPLKHDAGLFRGTEYLRKETKALILTRDTTLREYAYENVVRDELPLAIGIDSLIHMLALNSGGADTTSTDFIPLFSKLVKYSLFPEKDMFKPEDLTYISNSHININELPSSDIIQIAKKINKLRYSSHQDDDIDLEIRRLYQISVNDISDELIKIKGEKQNIAKESGNKDNHIDLLKQNLIETKYNEQLNISKRKVRWNFFYLSIIFIVTTILAFYIWNNIESIDKLEKFIVTIGSGALISLVIYLLGFKNKLIISKKEIRKKAIDEVEKINDYN